MSKYATQDMVAGVMFVVIGIGGLVVARDYPVGTANAMGPGYVPRILCLGIIGIGLILMMRTLLLGIGDDLRRFRIWPIVGILGAITLFGFMLEGLGIVISAVSLVLIASFAGDDVRPRQAVVAAALLTVFVIAVFIWGLELPLRIWPALPS